MGLCQAGEEGQGGENLLPEVWDLGVGKEDAAHGCPEGL